MRVITLSLLLASLLFSQDTKIFHVNGIMTSPLEAVKNKNQITRTLGTTYRDQNLTYVLAYNQTDGAISDILDVYNQKIVEYRRGNPSATDLQIVTFVSNITAALLHLPSIALTPVEVQQIEIDSIKRNIGGSVYADADSEHIRAAIETNTTAGNNVFLVAHSQGTLYANIVYDKLIADNVITPDKVKLFSVADVAAYMPNGDWLSSTLDPVITAVKLFFTTTAYNATEVGNLGHSLINTYLKEGSELLTIFTQKAQALLDTFTHIPFDGHIKVTLYGFASDPAYSGKNIPWIMDSKGTLLFTKYPLSYSLVNSDAIYIQELPVNQEINGTYTLDWVFNDVNITSGLIECGGSQKSVSIVKSSTNHFGKAIITKTKDGYECGLE